MGKTLEGEGTTGNFRPPITLSFKDKEKKKKKQNVSQQNKKEKILLNK